MTTRDFCAVGGFRRVEITKTRKCPMKAIPSREFQRLLGEQSDLAVLDVRTPAEFDEVHVAGARNVPLADLSPKALYEGGTLPAGKPVYLLCRSGARARQAAEKFAALGFDSAVVVEGGTLACVEAGMPVVRGTSKVISLERQVRIAAGSLVLVGVLGGYFVHPLLIWLAAFVGAGLVFAGVTDWCGMGLLLARAPWNQRKSG
jgi:rhodanese-related sulfurtransferase